MQTISPRDPVDGPGLTEPGVRGVRVAARRGGINEQRRGGRCGGHDPTLDTVRYITYITAGL
ncbi:hypothetical protein AB0O07_35965 [Streptomyces sp. NPDC093085]|uniref:hypothetical protein n=1 Tax=Streptomyces sp. NPDC093085 TaxID=3155068 RepID=UPI00343173DF